jgi:hypothetical protein
MHLQLLVEQGRHAAVNCTDRKHAREVALPASPPAPGGWSVAQRARADQEQFCTGLSSHQLPPPVLDVPWLPSSHGGKPQPGGQSSGGGSPLSRRLLQLSQPAVGGAAGLEVFKAQMAQHKVEVTGPARLQGRGLLDTQGTGQEQDLVPGAEEAAQMPIGGGSTRLALVPNIQSNLVLNSQPAQSESFKMYVHEMNDIVSNSILYSNSWEQSEEQVLVGALAALAKVRITLLPWACQSQD